jgi:hypothetical protein
MPTSKSRSKITPFARDFERMAKTVQKFREKSSEIFAGCCLETRFSL